MKQFHSIYRVVVVIALFFSCNILYAKERVVIASNAELKALRHIKPGSEIVWRNGEYSDEIVTINASGTAKKPVVLMAESGNCSVSCEDAKHDIEWRNNTIYGGFQRGISLAESEKKPNVTNVKLVLRKITANAGAPFMNKIITFATYK